jgi:uncharacterized protein
MATATGKFVWYDVMTTDCKAAEAFYTGVFGWTATDPGVADHPYTPLSIQETPVAGLMPIPPPAAGSPPRWTGYIGVDDVDAMCPRLTAAGGTIHRSPEDIPGVGRFAVVSDPHGAIFILYTQTCEGPAPQLQPDTPGTVGWHELHSNDWDKAFAFYSGLFGWTKREAVDMGPMGTYQTFATGDGPAVGGMMTRRPEIPGPFWLYYFNVPALDAATARVTKGRGKLLGDPHQVPGGSWIVHCTDPQGAMFAMVGPTR